MKDIPIETMALETLFKRSDLLNSESMLHGMLCALLSHPMEIVNHHWYSHLEGLIESPSLQEKSALFAYAKELQESLNNENYHLFLPAEMNDYDATESATTAANTSHSHQISAIANWIDGYIFAYATSSFIQNTEKNAQVDEWINTLQQSQRTLHQSIHNQQDSSQIPHKKQAEDVMEIVEFIRIGVYLTHHCWHQNQQQKQRTHH